MAALLRSMLASVCLHHGGHCGYQICTLAGQADYVVQLEGRLLANTHHVSLLWSCCCCSCCLLSAFQYEPHPSSNTSTLWLASYIPKALAWAFCFTVFVSPRLEPLYSAQACKVSSLQCLYLASNVCTLLGMSGHFAPAAFPAQPPVNYCS